MIRHEIDQMVGALRSRDDKLCLDAAHEIERLCSGLENIKTMEYDAGYSADEYADAVLSGDEPQRISG